MHFIDLHTHSTHSDGTYSPEELVLLAKTKGLSCIALTDHDTVSGIASCLEAGQIHDVQVIPGVELSASYGSIEIHILGYGIDHHHAPFLEILQDLATKRLSRNERMLEKLAALGLDITLEDLNPSGDTNTVFTRAHFANALVNKGYVRYSQEAFDRYLGDGKPAYLPKDHLSAKDCIALIHEAGGKAILAHPTLYKLNKSNIFEMIRDLISMGLDGVECMYPSYTPAQTKDFLKLCKQYDLISTGGSDFHGANKPLIQLGTGSGHLQIPDTFIEKLLQS